MRSYMVEELTAANIKRLKAGLDKEGLAGPIDDIYWLPIPKELLSDEQLSHQDECGDYFLSLETGDTWVKLELLARCRNRLRCGCIKYATPAQRAQAIDFLDETFRRLDIPV